MFTKQKQSVDSCYFCLLCRTDWLYAFWKVLEAFVQEDIIARCAVKCSLQSCSNTKYYTQISEYRDHSRMEKISVASNMQNRSSRTEDLCSHNVYSWQKEEEQVKGKRERLLAQEAMTESRICSLVRVKNMFITHQWLCSMTGDIS